VPLGEFELIDRFFRRTARRGDVLLGVGDDAALLAPPAGRVLVATTDTLVEGRHFLPGTPPESIGHQLLAVNLSDLAAMGADPAWALLSLSVPEADAGWLQRFADGLFALAAQHEVDLVGGDTVRGPRVLGLTALGFVEAGLALRRDGARPGDLLYVSGWPGEAAAGLEALRAGTPADADDRLVRRCFYAEPRIALGRALRGAATAAMDVSDGLIGDLGKLCAASGVGAHLQLERLPVSPELARRHDRAACEALVLRGGDDYELLFTLPADAATSLAGRLPAGPGVTCIGTIEAGAGVRCTRDGIPVAMEGGGHDHFA
jgi:thiamine-monophosphate kinase